MELFCVYDDTIEIEILYFVEAKKTGRMGDVCETDGKPIQKGLAGRHPQGKNTSRLWDLNWSEAWVMTCIWLVLQVHLMCLIASGMFRNRVCSEPDLLAITLSLLPTHFSMVAKERIDQNYLSGLLKWCVIVRSWTRLVCVCLCLFSFNLFLQV